MMSFDQLRGEIMQSVNRTILPSNIVSNNSCHIYSTVAVNMTNEQLQYCCDCNVARDVYL